MDGCRIYFASTPKMYFTEYTHVSQCSNKNCRAKLQPVLSTWRPHPFLGFVHLLCTVKGICGYVVCSDEICMNSSRSQPSNKVNVFVRHRQTNQQPNQIQWTYSKQLSGICFATTNWTSWSRTKGQMSVTTKRMWMQQTAPKCRRCREENLLHSNHSWSHPLDSRPVST